MDATPRDPELEARLTAAWQGLRLGHPCYAYQQLPSTMDTAQRLAEQGATESTCVWAETQTSGRGRAGRRWESPMGGIYLSLILRPTRDARDMPQLALVVGLAVAETVHEVTELWATIRWPNDVLLNGQKVAGILAEASTSACTSIYAVVGIGLNVTTARDDLPDGATALGLWMTPNLDRAALAATLLRCLQQAYDRWQAEGFAPIRAQLSRWFGLAGQLVHVTTAQGALQGQAVDIDDTGRLLVRLDSGVVRAIDMGDVTLLRSS